MTGTHHATDLFHTGDEIFREIAKKELIAQGVKNPDDVANKIVQDARSNDVSLVIIQQGELTRLITSLEKALQDKNRQYQMISDTIKLMKDVISFATNKSNNR